VAEGLVLLISNEKLIVGPQDAPERHFKMGPPFRIIKLVDYYYYYYYYLSLHLHPMKSQNVPAVIWATIEADSLFSTNFYHFSSS
jgi:hypothetical protein